MIEPDLIKRLREEKDLTQEELGRYIGVSKQAIQKYETGQSQMGSDKVEKYAEFFGVSPAFIMGWTTDRNYGLLSESDKDSYKPLKDFVHMLVTKSKINSLDDMSVEMYKNLLDLNEKCLLEYLNQQFQNKVK